MQLTLVLFYCYNYCFLETLQRLTVLTFVAAWQNGMLDIVALEKAAKKHCIKLVF